MQEGNSGGSTGVGDEYDTEVVQEPATYREIFSESLSEAMWALMAFLGIIFVIVAVIYTGALVHLHVVDVPFMAQNEQVVKEATTQEYLFLIVLFSLTAAMLFSEARKRA